MSSDPYQQANGLDALFDDVEDMLDSAAATPFEQSFNVPDDGDNELSMLMNEGGGDESFDLNELNARELDVGEKATNAIDYEDIGDDDSLPDEEFTQDTAPEGPSDLLPGIEDSALDGLNGLDDDDLFGPSSPILTTHEPLPVIAPSKPVDKPAPDADQDSDLASDHAEDDTQDISMLQDDVDDIEDAQYRIQLALFAQSGSGYAPTTEQENVEEWLKLEFPSFKRDENPHFNKLFPPRLQKWPAKTPLKPPKPIRPAKVSLEIEHDQKTAFNSALPPPVAVASSDVIKTREPVVHEEQESSDDSDEDEPLPNGMTMHDLEFICTDLDTLSQLALSDEDTADVEPRIVDSDDEMFGFDDFGDFDRPRKKRRLGLDPHQLVSVHEIDVRSFDDPERYTAKLAARVVLDLNDPQLLVEEVDPEALKAKVRPGEKVVAVRTLKDRLQHRFKTSNDAEYDLLKQNHQSKVRGQLTSMNIDHSVPAKRLQYPYYQVRLSIQDLRNYHRRRMHFKHNISFSPLNKIKRKHQKGKTVEQLYATTKHLSMGDNSSTLLLEYSEEHPLMLSQPGMGSKVINYYRKRTADDSVRPKHDVGETSVLLLEDKSPFYVFGHIEPGETISALYNSMYRAPIFQQDPLSHDFMVLRESTGQDGQRHYLRSLDNVCVVGQELPSTTIPGTHSRMVTTASKNRLKAISYRMARRKKTQRIRVEEVTKHFPDTTDMQNRQKMKEFMVFSKEFKEWEMKPGETIPDEKTIQSMIRPEDICLLESMQVGAQYLQDAGYADNDDDDDKDKDNDNDSIEQQLAPWRTTKNFMQATQGKAMLKLFGEGDPSGRGESFSFIKTSMKGGFRPIGGSAQDAITLKKELGGHSYNVARQQRSYEESIRGIWDKQKASLGSKIEPSDLDMDGDVDNQEDRYNERSSMRANSVSGTHTPAPGRRRDDETGTSFSKRSLTSQGQSSRCLQIFRTVVRDGKEVDEIQYENDPAVIKQYMRIKEMEEAQATRFVYIEYMPGPSSHHYSLQDIQVTGNADYDARQKKRQDSYSLGQAFFDMLMISRLEEALAKLEKNAARRKQRTKGKNALADATSPGGTALSPDPDGGAPGGKNTQPTQRKCANCGQVGHIKTNKKSVKCRHCNLPFDRKLGSLLGQAPMLEQVSAF